jgi:hypothetical protein
MPWKSWYFCSWGKQSQVRKLFQEVSESVCTLTIVVPPGPISAILSTSSAMKTPNPQSPGPSAALVETEGTQENILVYPNASEPASEGDTQM